MPSAGMGVDLFNPLTGGGILLIVPPGDCTSCVGNGVEFASELISCDTTVFSFGGSSTVGAGDEAIDGDSFLGRNLLSTFGGIDSTTILLCFLDDLSVRPFVSGVADMVIVVVDIDERYCYRCVVSIAVSLVDVLSMVVVSRCDGEFAVSKCGMQHEDRR